MTRLALFVTLLAICACPLMAATVTLSTNGQTAYTILIDPDAIEPEQHASSELASFLKQVTGAEFAIKTGTSVSVGPTIVVGPGRAARTLVPGVDFDDLAPDGLVIDTAGPHLVLAGDRPRGTLYAVYTFLEDVVGCRWWSSTASTIPSRPTLSLEERHDVFVPRLEYRETLWWDGFDGDWACRNKSNARAADLDEARGGHVVYQGFVHTFKALVPPDLFSEHPDWFSERDGKRIGGPGVLSQPCLTNDEVKEHVTQRVFAWIKANPSANIISVSQNDWDHHCLCAACKALEEEEGAPSGPLLHFVNYVAARVADRYPDIAIDTLAYQYTHKPPKHVKPLPNVIVRLCSVGCNFVEPLTHWSNDEFREDLEGWSKICDRLYIWDYTTNFAHYIQPHPNLRVLGDNIRFFVEHGVKGVFEQGNYQSSGGEFAELRAWVLAKLLWEPYRDEDALIAEFCDGYCGAAGPYVLEYINYLHDDAISSGYYVNIGNPTNAPFFTLDFMAKAEMLWNQAEAAVKDEPELLNRVQLSRLPVRYVWAMRRHEFQQEVEKRGIEWPGPADHVENVETFMAVARKNKVTRMSERWPIEEFVHRTIEFGRRESPPPPGCENLKPGEWIDLQDPGFEMWREGTQSRLVKDARASDGVAGWIDGKHAEWAIQQHLRTCGLEEGSTYTAYASVRAEKVGDEGPAFSVGVYDPVNRVFTASLYVECQDLADSEYHTYEITTAPMHCGMYLWAAPAANPDNVSAIAVDRFWLVKEK